MVGRIIFLCGLWLFSGCFFKPAFNSDGSMKDDAALDARPLCSSATIAPNFRFSSRRNGAVGRLDADELDDFVVHGFVPDIGGGTDIPYVWVYMGNPGGINLLCPDEEYPLPEYRFVESSPSAGCGEIGAVHIVNLFPTKSGHTGDLLVAAQTARCRVSLRWRSYAGANAVDLNKSFTAVSTPNWHDILASAPGFIASLQQSDTDVDIYWGGGSQIYASHVTANDFITSEFQEATFTDADAAIMMVRFGSAARDIATVAVSAALPDGDSLFLSPRKGAEITTPLTFMDLNFGKSTDQPIDIARQTSLTNPAVVVAKQFASGSEILEFSIPGPLGNHTLAPQFANSISIRDVFVTNFNSLDPTLRNQWKLLLLKQERYSSSGGNLSLVLYDADALSGKLDEASEQPLRLPADDISNDFPPFMVVGNFESTSKKSVRVFHRVRGVPMATGIACFTLNISADNHDTMSVPADLAPIACAR